MKRRLLIVLTLSLLAARLHADAPSFNRDIKPILSDKCFMCHGPDEKARKGKLRLDLESAARAAVGTALENSKLFTRITAANADDRMPPTASGKSLSETEIAKLRAWVESGGKYEQHWAFVPPQRPEPPAVQNAAWSRNEIDRFILAKLEAQHIAPSPQADPITLLRRVYLDLVGLPPAPQEVAAFVADPSPEAYARVVDQLLASLHFGERWGRHWLDAAHYADSNGYSVDAPRSIWPYRDWVINAINRDLPFDQFVTEQLAGDLLPNATTEQKTATGFLRNTMINEEGGIDKEEFRQEAVLDRVNTLGTTLLGLTLGCAKCHSHKYDPIEQREYYQLMAFLNNDDEPSLEISAPEYDAAKAEFDKKLKDLKDAQQAYLDGATEKRKAWEAELKLPFLQSLDEEDRGALATPWDQRTPEQAGFALSVFRKNDLEAAARDEAIKKLEKDRPKAPTTMVVAARKEPRETHLRV